MYFKITGMAILSLMLINSCDKDEENQNGTSPGVKIISNAKFGNILADQDNRSLYFSANDITGESACNGGCAEVWPPLTVNVFDLEIGAGLNADDFGTITRDDGLKQITFKGWPLYYFSPNSDGVLELADNINGDGRGDVFYIAKPDYSILLGKQVVEEGKNPALYIVDDMGVSLYLNTGDDKEFSNCSGGCADVWPPFDAPGTLIVPSLLDANDFSVIYREDDLGPQLGFLGKPLYHFSVDDQKRGNVLGQSGGPAKSFFIVEPR